jgi:hypothetical protein
MSFEPWRGIQIQLRRQPGVANFDIKFEEDTEITGYMKLRLWWKPRATMTWISSSTSRS